VCSKLNQVHSCTGAGPSRASTRGAWETVSGARGKLGRGRAGGNGVCGKQGRGAGGRAGGAGKAGAWSVREAGAWGGGLARSVVGWLDF
jgi:hypothetical protein